ncbi:MAG: YncE family protein [Deltaproteobacteria bacterium]|nr:YncE family protein [Deltaproteobacteria bacterium]
MRRYVPWLVAVGLIIPRLAQGIPYVYVANADSDDVTVIDAATNAVVTVAADIEPRNPAVSPTGSRVYVPNRHADNVTVINGVTNAVITTISDPGFNEPYSAAVSPDGSRVYIANKKGGTLFNGSLTVINAGNNTVITTIEDACFGSPEWVTVNPAGARAYVVNRQSDSVCIVDTAGNSVVGSVSVGSEPRSAVVSCDGAFVYVANNAGNPDVTRIRTSDNSVFGIDFTGSANPRNMSMTPDGSKVYVGLQNNSLGIIDTAAATASKLTLAGASSTYGTAVTADGALVFVTDESTGDVHVVAAATDTEITGAGFPIGAGTTPRGLATAFACRRVSRAAAPMSSPLALLVTVVMLVAVGTGYRRVVRARPAEPVMS